MMLPLKSDRKHVYEQKEQNFFNFSENFYRKFNFGWSREDILPSLFKNSYESACPAFVGHLGRGGSTRQNEQKTSCAHMADSQN